MNSEYLIPASRTEYELEVKRSRFLTVAAHAPNPDSAERLIKSLRQQHPQASHVCWAYIAGAPNTTLRSMSDDGEPSGTAGKPMLNVLQYSGLGEIVVAIVRYFGGTKLGTGGLQRAYSDAVSEVLQRLPTVRKVIRSQLRIELDYPDEGGFQQLCVSYDTEMIKSEYTSRVSHTLAVAATQATDFMLAVTNLTHGKASITEE